MNISCIYIIKSKIKPDCFYVGSAFNISMRKSKHITFWKKNKHPNKIIQNHVNKYGYDDLYFELLEVITDKAIILKREQYYIDTLNPYFNINRIAGSRQGCKISEEHKKKIAKASANRIWSQESKDKISNSKKGKPFSGTTYKGNQYTNNPNYKTKTIITTCKRHDDEWRRKMSVIMVGKNRGLKRSEEFRKLQSERMIGKKRGKYNKIKIAA